MDNTFRQVRDALVGVFGEDQRAALTEDASMDTVAAWDSMSFVQVMIALESTFGISISPDDATELTSVKGIMKLISKEK